MITNEPGLPFGAEGVSNQQDPPTEAERRGIERQIAGLSQNYPDVQDSQRMANTTRLERRAGLTGGLLSQSAAPLSPFQVDGVELLANDELLVRTKDYGDPGDLTLTNEVRQRLATFVVHADKVAELDGQIVRLRLENKVGDVGNGTYLTAQELGPIAAGLRLLGYQASVNQDVPLGYPTKWTSGPTGPEPSDRLRKPEFPAVKSETPGRPVTVAVVDTGISDQPRTDRWLDGTLGLAQRPADIDPLYQFNRRQYGPGSIVFDFGAGHGTFVSGIISQVAPFANIKMYRAIDGDGTGSDVDVAVGVWRAFNDGARIINLSLGTIAPDDQPPLAILVALELISAVRVAQGDEGDDVVIVAAAGNNGDTRPVFPAALCATPIVGVHVVAVAGLAADHSPSWLSTRGFWVTCSTVAEGVLSTFAAGLENATKTARVWTQPNPWAVWTGTSFAAPQVSGAIAARCQATGESPELALRWLLNEGVSMPNFGKVLKILG